MSRFKKILLFIPIFIILIDILNYYFIPEGVGEIFRAIVLYLVFLYFFVSKGGIVLDYAYKGFLFFFFFVFFDALINSSNLFISISGSLSIFISTSYYLLSYSTFKHRTDISSFSIWFSVIPLLFFINLILFTTLGLGDPVYGSNTTIRVGNLHHSRIYSGSLVILLSFVLMRYSKLKLLHSLLIYLLFVILLLSMRRTALLIIFLGLIIYLALYKKTNVLKYLFLTFLFLILTFPFYKNQLNEVLEARGSRVSANEEALEEETRYLEVIVVTNKIFSFTDFAYSLFGTEFLNSIGTYSTPEIKMPNDRILHTDYAVIIHGAGIIGFVLYIIFSLLLFNPMVKYIKYFGFKNEITILTLMMFSTFLLVTISGSILNITFRTMYFIIMGALNRIINEEIKIIKYEYFIHN